MDLGNTYGAAQGASRKAISSDVASWRRKACSRFHQLTDTSVGSDSGPISGCSCPISRNPTRRNHGIELLLDKIEQLTRRHRVQFDAALPSARPFAAAISTAPVFKRRSRRVLEPRFLPDASTAKTMRCVVPRLTITVSPCSRDSANPIARIVSSALPQSAA